MTQIVTIATFNQVPEAEAALTLLESRGIKASLDIPYSGRLQAGLIVASSGVKLAVSAIDAERASEILAARGIAVARPRRST